MEFTMAAVIAEAKALDPAMLKEARRRMDWPKWDLAIEGVLYTPPHLPMDSMSIMSSP